MNNLQRLKYRNDAEEDDLMCLEVRQMTVAAGSVSPRIVLARIVYSPRCSSVLQLTAVQSEPLVQG